MNLYSGPQMARITGLTYRQVDHWTRLGVLWPQIEATGSGHPRGYDDREVVVAICLKQLAELGAPVMTTLRLTAMTLRWLDVGQLRGRFYISADGGVHRDPPPSASWTLNVDQITVPAGDHATVI